MTAEIVTHTVDGRVGIVTINRPDKLNAISLELNIDGGDLIKVYFNPTEYSIAKTNTWEAEKVNGKSSPNQKFTSGNPRKMELSLLFDQTMPPYTMSVGEANSS